jgi:hypothetical protein
LAGSDAVLVHYAERSELRVGGIEVVTERKSVPGVQPAVIEMTTIGGVSNVYHDWLFL